MFVCCVCKCSINVCNFVQIRKHLQDHLLLGDLRYPIKCQQERCSSDFGSIYNFMRHFKSFHAVAQSNNVLPVVEETVDETVDDDMSVDEEIMSRPCSPFVSDLSTDLNSSLSSEAMSLMCMLRANSAVPYSIVSEVMSSCSAMVNSVVDHIVEHCNKQPKNDDSLKQLVDSLGNFENPIKSLISNYQQANAIKSHRLYVEPTSLTVGLPSIEARNRAGTIENVNVYKEFNYVSLLQTLKCLFSKKDFYDAFTQTSIKRTTDFDECVTDFHGGDRYKRNEFLQKPNTVLLQLFYDDMATTNPLRGACAYYNVGVFYYTIKNLPTYYNSCFSNVHLLALCHAMDFAECGFSFVLEELMREIRILETCGIEVDVEGLGSRTFFGTLFQVTCDNLALNSIFGFIKSFNCDYFCVHCYALKDEIQFKFRENEFKMRNKMDYQNDLKMAEGMQTHVKGVTGKYCMLNNSQHFHIMENRTNDCMNTLLEGIVPFEIGCILSQLVGHDKLFTLAAVNQKLAAYYALSSVEKKDKPLEISSVQCTGKGISPSMKAVQIWSLLRFLPLVLHELVPTKNLYVTLLQHLCYLTSIVFSPCFTPGVLIFLEDFIADHLTMFKNAFPDVTLKPKHHFLIHYPNIIRANGPPMSYSCLRYELKNSFFKRSAHIVCNFRNITQTLAARHQYSAFFGRLSGKDLRDFVLVNKSDRVFVSSLPGCNVVCTDFNCTVHDEVFVSDVLNYRGKILKSNCVVAVKGQHCCFLCHLTKFVKFDSIWKFIGTRMDPICYIEGTCCIEVKHSKPSDVKVISLDELYDAEPLDLLAVGSTLLVILKWNIVGLDM